MALCSRSSQDPLLRELLDKGINLILPPRDDLVPGDLVISEGNRARRASWSSAVGVEPDRKIVSRSTFKSFDLRVSEKLTVGIAAKLSGAVLAQFGLTSGSLTTALTTAKCDRVTMKLVAPAMSQLVDPDGLLDQLRAADASPLPAYEDFSFFLIRGVWRTKGLSLELYDSQDRRVTATTEVADTLSGELGLTLSADMAGKLSFRAPTALIFGIEVGELRFSGGTVKENSAKTVLKFRASGKSKAVIPTEDDSAFVSLANLEGE